MCCRHQIQVLEPEFLLSLYCIQAQAVAQKAFSNHRNRFLLTFFSVPTFFWLGCTINGGGEKNPKYNQHFFIDVTVVSLFPMSGKDQ